MRIVFLGSSKFGLRCLQLLKSMACCRIAGVVTAPERFAISYRPEGVTNVLHADIASYCVEQDIPAIAIRSGMNDPDLLDQVGRWNPDVFIVAGWYHMVTRAWRDMAPSYGLHASLLPDYSGGAPLVWAMINGESSTGITLFQMDAGVDSGPIVGQLKEPITSVDTIATLHARIEERGLDLLRCHVPQMSEGTMILSLQDESKRRIMPQRGPEDGLIGWGGSVDYIDRFVRAQTRPYPGAFTTLDGKRITIWRAAPCPPIGGQAALPGRVACSGTRYYVQCGEGSLRLAEVSFAERDYSETEMSELLGPGEQILGVD